MAIFSKNYKNRPAAKSFALRPPGPSAAKAPPRDRRLLSQNPICNMLE